MEWLRQVSVIAAGGSLLALVVWTTRRAGTATTKAIQQRILETVEEISRATNHVEPGAPTLIEQVGALGATQREQGEVLRSHGEQITAIRLDLLANTALIAANTEERK